MNISDFPERQARQVRTLLELAARLPGDADSLSGKDPGAAGGELLESDQFAVHIAWTGTAPLLPERTYRARSAGHEFRFQVTDLTYQIDRQSSEHLAAKTLQPGALAYCKIATDPTIAFSADSTGRTDQVIVFFDSDSAEPVGVGVIDFALRRATNIAWQRTTVDKAARAQANVQQPCVLWFTGLSGAGKSTIADLVEQKLHAAGRRTYLLDGDNVRHGLCKDLGFTDADRVENIRRVAEVARLMADAGLIVIASFISPFTSERRMARELVGTEEFIEVFVDTPLSICEARDPKGLYQKARTGVLKNFTGIDSAYEVPEHAELVLQTVEHTSEVLADQIVGYLQAHHFFSHG